MYNKCKNRLDMLINNFPRKYKLRRYKIYLENINKSLKEIYYDYLEELDRIDKKKCVDIDKNEYKISIDAFGKYVRKIDREGIRSIFIREDIVELAMSINPTYVNYEFNINQCKNYIKKIRVELESGYFADFQNVYKERFTKEETLRKELLKYIKKYRNKVIDVNTLKAKNDIYFIQLKTYNICDESDNANNVTDDDIVMNLSNDANINNVINEEDNENNVSEDEKKKIGYIVIKCFRYKDNKLKIVFEDKYKSTYLKSYIEDVDSGYINYSILKRKEIIEKSCYNKLCNCIENLGYEKGYYLLMSRYSEGIISQALCDKERNIEFKLAEGNLKKLKEKKEKKQTDIPSGENCC